jgi:hypothetical protein
MSLSTFKRLYRILRMNVFSFLKAAGWPEPTHQQREVLDDIQRHTLEGRPYYGAAKSGQGVGKTNLEAGVALWRAFRSYGAPTYVTAPTMRQVKDVFLKELRLNLERGDPTLKQMINVLTTRATICGMRDWGVIAITATKPENFQGLHHPHMSILADEGSGIAREIFETIFGTLSQGGERQVDDAFFLTCGNPNTRDCAFFDFFNAMRDRFCTYTLNSLESPLVNPENIQRIIDLYGQDSDVYRVRVLGQFPHTDPKCVMSSDDLEACTKVPMTEAAASRKYLQHMAAEMRMRQIGIDFARYGIDKSVIYRRSGLAVVEQALFSRTEPDVVVAKAFEMQHRANWKDNETYYVCDADGMGQGLMSHFYRARKTITEFHNGGTARHSKQYHDKITEAMFELGALVKAHSVHIPRDQMLIKELSTRQYHMAGGKLGKGRVKLESKEDYTRRTGENSPDRADAICMAFYPYAYGAARTARRR